MCRLPQTLGQTVFDVLILRLQMADIWGGFYQKRELQLESCKYRTQGVFLLNILKYLFATAQLLNLQLDRLPQVLLQVDQLLEKFGLALLARADFTFYYQTITQPTNQQT